MKCAIICSGTSIERVNLAKIIRTKIGVNHACLATDLDIHVITGGILGRRYRDRLDELSLGASQRYSVIYSAGAFRPKIIYKYMWEAYKNKEKVPQLPPAYDIHRDGWILAGGAPGALQVAISYGFTDIVFVGLDLYEKTHRRFYEAEPRAGKEDPYKRGGLVQRHVLEQFKPYLKDRGITVVNTGDSDVFPQVSFDEVWK